MLRRFLIFSALAVSLIPQSTFAMTSAEALKKFSHDGDQTLEAPEVIDAAGKLFRQLNTDKDTTLERKETSDRLTEDDWKAVNKDNDNTLELDEWLTIARQRFDAADSNKDGKITIQELDSPAGQKLLKMMVK